MWVVWKASAGFGSFGGSRRISEDPALGPGRWAQGAENWTFKPVMKKGGFAGYVALILVTTLLQTCLVTAFLADAAPQPFATGWLLYPPALRCSAQLLAFLNCTVASRWF